MAETKKTTKKVEKKSLHEKLSWIQNEMNVPKNLFNKFGNYNYRNAETILESAKPICHKHRCTLTVCDSIKVFGDRFYICAIATLTDWDSDDVIENVAFARETDNKKGMDSAQITGATSSYARKYALNGLFNLDDNKDPDSNEFKEQNDNKQKSQTQQPQPNLTKEQYEQEHSNLAIRCNGGINKLRELGIDIRSDEFMQNLQKETGLTSVDYASFDLNTLQNFFVYITKIYKKEDSKRKRMEAKQKRQEEKEQGELNNGTNTTNPSGE